MTVSIRFDSKLDYQIKAVESVVNLFEGALAHPHGEFGGINPNPEIISLNVLKANVARIQKSNQLPFEKGLQMEKIGLYERPNFTIEMETGTGKTYIFLRTILELNKRFGLKKFIIVVPSVAIREGVLANLRLTKSHFLQLYDRLPYNFRVFSSNKLTDLSTFCRSNQLEIMVITIQSFNKKDFNTLYDEGRDDILLANSGMEMLSQTKPVLVLDEPHKMSSELSQSALENLNPLFILRYSATHRDLDKTSLVYSLGPVDAHRLGLVKKIDVIGTTVSHESSLPLIKLLDTKLSPKIQAKLLLRLRTNQKFLEKSVWVQKGDYLIKKTKNPAYKDMYVINISARENDSFVEFNGGKKVRFGESIGDTYLIMAREQIRHTIRTHMEKQEKLKKHRIKVLSLFFLDEVTDYQELDANTEAGNEEIQQIDQKKYLFVRKAFDEIFNQEKRNYSDWKDKKSIDVRGAYFSARKTFKSIEQDREKIDEILRDKEKLLSFESPTSFIFTHSALAEGWDNPNVFNICTLRITNSKFTKRQAIGRGLRIPVSQDGLRYENPDENKLTVIANESFEEFAKNLQTNYEEEGIMTKPAIENRLEVIKAKLKKPVFHSKFMDMWKRLRIKTVFESEIDTNKLVKTCVKLIDDEVFVEKPLLITRKAELTFGKNEIITKEEQEAAPIQEVEVSYSIPDMVTRICGETQLTKKTISQILLSIQRLDEIYKNPEEFISKVGAIIRDQKKRMEVQTIQYRITDKTFEDSIFEDEILSYKNKVVETNRSVYDKTICDSEGEKEFANRLDQTTNVNVFCKIPSGYFIETPVGKYNPDWAIVYEKMVNRAKKWYLVRETKFGYSPLSGTLNTITDIEKDKIECAKKHFKVLTDIDFNVAYTFQEFIEQTRKLS